jgi:hypothetical protein
MNIDPQLSARYLGENGLKDARVVDALMDRLTKSPEDRFDGLDLHILDAMRHRRFGDAEAKQFKKIATDPCRRWPIRGYSWAAFARSTQNYSELMEAATSETIPQLRRSIITNLKGRGRRTFLEHARVNFPESRYTVRWTQAA